MSLIQLHLNDPDLFKHGTTADVVDAAKKRADYESSAPTGLPSMTDVEAWENLLIGLYTNTGQIVTPERARRCATVLAIMRGISEDVSCLPKPLYKRGDKEDTIAYNHPVHKLLNVTPNELMTPLEVGEHMIMNLMLWGGFFNLKEMDKNVLIGDPGFGEVAGLWPLDSAYVTRRYREEIWTFTDPVTGMSGEFAPDGVWRAQMLGTNAIDGIGITTLAKEAIGLLLAAEEQGARLFKQGVQTDLALETTESLDAADKQQLRKAFMERHSGSRNAFMPLLLEGGLKANKIGLTAQESQYLEAREFQVADIARVFRYPDVLLGAGGSKGSKGSTYASAEQFFMSYTKHTLGPWTTRIEQSGNRDLLSPKEQAKYYIKHDFTSLLKADETARIAIWNAKIQGGWAQPAEARRAEGMPYKDGLEYFSKPAGSTGVAGQKPGPQNPDPTPQDQSSQLISRVALHLYNKEEKAIVANKQDADSFYTNFGSYLEGMTLASPVAIRRYLETRRNTPQAERFSVERMQDTLIALGNLCEGEL